MLSQAVRGTGRSAKGAVFAAYILVMIIHMTLCGMLMCILLGQVISSSAENRAKCHLVQIPAAMSAAAH